MKDLTTSAARRSSYLLPANLDPSNPAHHDAILEAAEQIKESRAEEDSGGPLLPNPNNPNAELTRREKEREAENTDKADSPNKPRNNKSVSDEEEPLLPAGACLDCD